MNQLHKSLIPFKNQEENVKELQNKCFTYICGWTPLFTWWPVPQGNSMFVRIFWTPIRQIHYGIALSEKDTCDAFKFGQNKAPQSAAAFWLVLFLFHECAAYLGCCLLIGTHQNSFTFKDNGQDNTKYDKKTFHFLAYSWCIAGDDWQTYQCAGDAPRSRLIISRCVVCCAIVTIVIWGHRSGLMSNGDRGPDSKINMLNNVLFVENGAIHSSGSGGNSDICRFGQLCAKASWPITFFSALSLNHI